MSLAPGEDATAVRAAIDRVITRGWFILGPGAVGLRAGVRRASGAAHAVGVGTGTDAIALTLRALGIGAGDEVITTPLSAAYRALAIMMAGATPVFADIDPDRLTIDPARHRGRHHAADARRSCRSICTASRPTWRASPPIAGAARPGDRRGLLPGAPRHLRRAAGRQLRRRGRVQLLSDQEPRRARRRRAPSRRTTRRSPNAAALRNGGQTDRYHHAEFGVNSRLDEMQAAILRERLTAPARRGRRRRRAHRERATATVSPDGPVTVPPRVRSRPRLSPLPGADARTAPRCMAHLERAGIGTIIHYPVPIPRQPALAGIAAPDTVRLPIASAARSARSRSIRT